MLRSCARVVVVCAAALSCNRLPPGAVAVGTLSVSEANLTRVPDLGLSVQQVRKELKTALERTRHFAFREGASARVRLEVESARRLAGGEGAVADVQLILELTAASPEGDQERTVSEGAGRSTTAADAGTEGAVRLAAFEGALRGALDDAARGLAWQLESRRKTDDELARDLGDADPRVRDYAIRALADRRSPAVVPQLVAQVLYALASLGGPTAEAFLYTLESGSPDDEVRHAATEALAELRRKRDESSAHGVDPTRPRSH